MVAKEGVFGCQSQEEAVETEVFHSQIFKQTIQNSFLVT